MGYLNNVMGYRDGLLKTRSFIKPGNCALLTEDGLVKNVVPGFENADVTILGSPRLGAHFVDYRCVIKPNGGHFDGFGGGKVQSLIYVINGELEVTIENETHHLSTRGYAYAPAGSKLFFKNTSNEETKVFLYKKIYDSVDGKFATYPVVGNTDNLEWIEYEGMKDVLICDFLPKDIAFDMNFHILDFAPGASHGYIETHVQEHGALLLSGQGMYNLDNEWLPVQKGDYIFMGAYSLQAAYAVGREEHLSYVYSKDCNRDIELQD